MGLNGDTLCRTVNLVRTKSSVLLRTIAQFVREHKDTINALSSVFLLIVTACYTVETYFNVSASIRVADATEQMRAMAGSNLKVAQEMLDQAKREFLLRDRPYVSADLDISKPYPLSEDRRSLMLYTKVVIHGDLPAFRVGKYIRAVVNGKQIYSSDNGFRSVLFPKDDTGWIMSIPADVFDRVVNAAERQDTYIELHLDYAASSDPSARSYYYVERLQPRWRPADKTIQFLGLERSAD